MLWIARLIALASIVFLADAAVASIYGATPALVAVCAGAALAILGLALAWQRPWIAVAIALCALAAAFAFGTLAGSGEGPALTGLLPGDAAAVVLALILVAGAIGACAASRSLGLRVFVALVALYAVGGTLPSVGHGGLAAAFGSAPLAWTRGAYVAAELLLPAGAGVALVWGLLQFGRRRSTAGTAALVFAVALAAAAHLGAYAAGAAGLPTIVAFERPPVISDAPVAAAASDTAALTSSSSVRGVSAGSTPELVAVVAGPRFNLKSAALVPAEVAAAAGRLAPDPQHALAVVSAMADDLYPGALGGSAGAQRRQRFYRKVAQCFPLRVARVRAEFHGKTRLRIFAAYRRAHRGVASRITEYSGQRR